MNEPKPKFARAVSRIVEYWDGMIGRRSVGGEACIGISVMFLSILFVLALPWFVAVALKRGLAGARSGAP